MSKRPCTTLCILFTTMFVGSSAANEVTPPVFDRTTDLAPAVAVTQLKAALMDNGFSDIRDSAEGDSIAVSFSQPDIAHRLVQADTGLTTMFPLSVSVVAAGSGSTLSFARPLALQPNEAALNTTSQLEQVVVQTIESAITPTY